MEVEIDLRWLRIASWSVLSGLGAILKALGAILRALGRSWKPLGGSKMPSWALRERPGAKRTGTNGPLAEGISAPLRGGKGEGILWKSLLLRRIALTACNTLTSRVRRIYIC